MTTGSSMALIRLRAVARSISLRGSASARTAWAIRPGRSRVPLILIGAGVIATIGQWMLVLAARQGEASVIMSFDYLRLPFVALLELTILGVVPELASLIGGGVIALAAIYMARREARIRNRSLVAESKASKTF